MISERRSICDPAARIESPETQGLRSVAAIDEPRHFAAYLDALEC